MLDKLDKKTDAEKKAPNGDGKLGWPGGPVNIRRDIPYLKGKQGEFERINENIEVYKEGHIPGAISWNWRTDLVDKLRRDILGPSDLEALLSQSGISNTTTIVLYGDKRNWCAAWAFWQLQIYGHRDVRILNGGREKWVAEGRELSKALPNIKPSKYRSRTLNQDLRAFLPLVKTAVKSQDYAIVDVRSEAEFTGNAKSTQERPEASQRTGHIPGA